METKRTIKKILTIIAIFIGILLTQGNVKAGIDYGDYAHNGGEYIAGNVDALKAGLGQTAGWTNHTKPGDGNDYVYGVQKYTTLQCADYAGSNWKEFDQLPVLYGVIDINRTAGQENNNMYTTAELWTPGGGSYTQKSADMAYLAYIAWASGAGKYTSSAKAWNNHWYSETSKLNSLCAGKVHGWTTAWRTSGSQNREASSDANNYASFVSKIGDDGVFISNDNHKEGKKSGDNGAQITFDKLIIDDNYNSYKGQGTGQKIEVSVTAQNGARASFNVDKDGTHDRAGRGLSINGKPFESITLADLNTTSWTITWDDGTVNATNPITQVIVANSFYSYHGVIAMMYPKTQGHAQGRMLTSGGPGRQRHPVIFTLDGDTTIKVDKCWAGYQKAENFQMPGSVGFILYATLDTGMEVEYGRYSIPNNGTDRWTFELNDVKMTMEGGFRITSFRVEEEPLNLGEGWTTTVTPQGNNYWVITNAYEKEDKIPLLELDKVNESGGQLVGATLTVTLDNSYTAGFTSKGKDPDITITFNEVIDEDPKMKANFQAQNAVELFNYSENKKPKGPVGELPDDIYTYLKGELYSRLMGELAKDPGYQEDQRHVSMQTTHIHDYDDEGNPIYDSYCGFNGHCEAGCTCCAKAAERIRKAHEAIRKYVYGSGSGENTSGGISKNNILRDLHDKHDYECNTGVGKYSTTNPIHVDEFEYSVWLMYERFPEEIHLNDLAAIYTTKQLSYAIDPDLDVEMEIKVEEAGVPTNYLTWKNDNDKHLYLTWELGQVTSFHYDQDDNDSRELEYIDKESTDTKLEGATTKSCENNITWTLMSIRAWNAKLEDIIQFTKYAELANGNSSSTKPMEGVSFSVKIEAKEKLDGAGIAQGGFREASWTTQKTTDSSGYFGIDTKELQDGLGIDVISRWIGSMTITYEETSLGKYADYYEKWFTPRSITVEFNEGSASITGEQEGRGEDAIVSSSQGYTVRTSGYDTPSQAPQMIIKKTDMAGNALEGAVFDVTIQSDRGESVRLGQCVTNKAGEFIIYPEDLEGLQITTMNRWTGDLTLIAREIKAPDKYTNLNEDRDIIATIHFAHGQISSASINGGNEVDWSIHSTWYEDQQTWEGSSPTFVLSVKNSFEDKLRIRKVEGNTEKQDYLDDRYLNEAEFDLRISNGGSRVTAKAKLDSKGYFVLTDGSQISSLVNRVAGDLGQFTGTLEVSIKETRTPNGYVAIRDTLTTYLKYEHGYYQGATYNDDTSKVLLDVGKSDDEATVTIAVKNTKLQPIYIQKMDPTTNLSVKGVAFDVTISREAIMDQDSAKAKTYTTGDEGMIAITTDELNKIGIKDAYTGDLYVLVEERSTDDGYTMLQGPVYVHIRYEGGNIVSSELLRGDGSTTWINKNGTGMLKIIVNNPWEIPDIEILKETLTNGETYVIDDATFYIELSTDRGDRYSQEFNVSKAGKILFDSDTLNRELHVDGTYTGKIEVYISEINVREDAAVVNEGFTVTLTYKDGKMIESEVENKTHASVVRNNSGSKVTIMVNDSIIIPDHIFLGGYVWEEKATTKAGLLKDGIYTQMSDSEHTDQMLTGIEATLYIKESDGTLRFADDVAGTNPTLTDVNGYYEFEVPKGPQYVVKFTYNGQAFEDSAVDKSSKIYSREWASKGTEISAGEESRQFINNLYNEIGSYPANYKVGNFIFNSTEARNYFTIADNGDIYNIAYRNAEISDVYEKVVIEMNKYLGESKYLDKDNEQAAMSAYAEIYRNVIKNYYSDADKEIYNKLQYIYDSRISAVAGDNTESYELTDFANLASYTDTYKYINLGIVKRDMTDLMLTKDAYSATISINRKDTVYDYDKKLGKYTLLNYEEDYNYNQAPNSNGKAYYTDDQIELYLSYKVTVKNETNVNTQLTEIVDYFDSRFGYKNEYTTSGGATLSGIRAYKVNEKGEKVAEITGDLDTSKAATGKYIEASRIGLDHGRNQDYSELYVTFADGKEPSLKMNESVEFYITIKLGKGGEDGDNENYLVAPKYENNSKSAKEILYKFTHGDRDEFVNDMMKVFNYAEINGYQTFDENGNKKGYLDSDSKPGTFIVKDFEDIMNDYYNAFEALQKNPSKANRDAFTNMLDKVNQMRGDDTWAVEVDVKNNLNDAQNNYYHRSVNGNVWEAVTDEVKTSTDLYNDRLLTYIEKNGIQGIPVELVELEPDGNQIVRAKTVTDGDGRYEFTGFIPGDYTIRFIYGATNRDGYSNDQNNTMRDTSINGYKDIAKNRGVNGQYYQSTKANPNTDRVEYWYEEYAIDNNGAIKYQVSSNPGFTVANTEESARRYSDAYDEVTARIEQIESQTNGDAARSAENTSVANVEKSWSWDYEWDGVYNTQTRNHLDQMEAYTSTLNFEVENTKVQLEGNREYGYYRYQIDNVDFGLTPRAEADLNIDKYVSNIKVYLADNTNNANGTLQLDVDLIANGSIQEIKYKNDALFNNIVIPTSGENNTAYRDGLLEILYDTQLLNGATIEVTYTITVSNDGQPNTITYFYDGNDIAAHDGKITDEISPIAHAYYNGDDGQFNQYRESLSHLTVFENDRKAQKLDFATTVFTSHYKTSSTANNTIMKYNAGESKARRAENNSNRYAIKDAAADKAVFVNVKTRATNIVDYIDPNLNFTETKVSGEKTNADWDLTDVSKFNSTREEYKGTGVVTDVMTKYNNIVRAVGGDTYKSYLAYLAAVANGEENNVMNGQVPDGKVYSELYKPLLPGESAIATLTLSKVLQTSSTETNDYEYSNLIELTRMENYAGKIIDLEDYDITGESRPETSAIGDLANVPSKDTTRLQPPTMGTSKSETIVIHEPTGLSITEAPKANLGIVLIVLVILATGIILIKKFVLTPKNN